MERYADSAPHELTQSSKKLELDIPLASTHNPKHDTASQVRRDRPILRYEVDWGRPKALPVELHEQVMQNLPLKDLFYIGQLVCKTWKNVMMNSPKLRETMFLDHAHPPYEVWEVLTAGNPTFDAKRQYEVLTFRRQGLPWHSFRPQSCARRTPFAASEFPWGLAEASGRFSARDPALIAPVALNSFLRLVNAGKDLISRRKGGYYFGRAVLDVSRDLFDNDRASIWNTYLTNPPCTHAKMTVVEVFHDIVEAGGGPLAGRVDHIYLSSSNGLKMADIRSSARVQKGVAEFATHRDKDGGIYRDLDRYLWNGPGNKIYRRPLSSVLGEQNSMQAIRYKVRKYSGGEKDLKGDNILVGLELMSAGSATITIPSMRDRQYLRAQTEEPAWQ